MPKQTFFNLTQDKRERILRAAQRVFAATAYRRVTIDSLVDEANIPKGSFYQYFHDKDDLYIHLFAQLGLEKERILRKTLEANGDRSFLEQMNALLREGIAFERSGERLGELYGRFMSECPQDVRRRVEKAYRPMERALYEKIVTMHITRGAFREDLDVRSCAFLLAGALGRMDVFPFRDGEDPLEAAMGLLAILERGFARRA